MRKNMDFVKKRIGAIIEELERLKLSEHNNKVFRIRPYGVIRNEEYVSLLEEVGKLSHCVGLLALELEELKK
jgi:hypothetical protein